MSSAEATVDDTVPMTTTARGDDTTRAGTVLAVIVAAQLVWLVALIYGISLLL